jgi:cysteine-rich repeat protein
MTSMFGPRAVALLGLIVLSSCSPEIKDSPTQIMLRVDSSNSELKKSFTDLQVSLARRDGDHWEQGSKLKLSRTNVDDRWPVDLPVVPRTTADEIKQFQVVLELMKGNKLLAQSRVVTTFLPDSRRVLEVWIETCPGHDPGFVCAEADCVGEQCEVCSPSDGACIPVGVTNPKMLAPLTDDAIALDRDAGAVGKIRDTGLSRDARPAVDPGEDAELPSGGPDAVDDAPDAGETQQQACESEGSMRCAKAGAPQRQVCESGTWVDADPCAENEICDGTKPDAPTCVSLSSACKGSAGKSVCAGSVLQLCSDQGVATSQKDCTSEPLCQLGLAGGKCAACMPGVARCTGAKLEVCSQNGLGFELKEACESASLCNAPAAACTKSACLPGTKTCAGDVLRACNADQTAFEVAETCEAGLCDSTGKQCDICLAGSTKCDGDVVQTCSADGQSYRMMACSGQTSHCVGSGKCVQCRQTSDCPVPTSDCVVATCNVAAGTCGTTNKPAQSACGTGICDGKGSCGPRPTCGDGVVNQASEQCDDGNRIELDDCMNNCKSAFCGDGLVNSLGTSATLKEDCDVTAGSDTWKCTSKCKKSTMYNACSSGSSCSNGETCNAGICTTNCSQPGATGPLSGCPAVIRQPFVAMCWFSGACFVSGCSGNADCPEGLACYKGLDSNNPTTSICAQVQ